MFLKGLEYNFAIIPIRYASKVPWIEDWSRFSDRLPTIDETSNWDESFKKCNYGVVLGKASNLIALDIDVDDESVIKSLPQSPCAKRGARGITYFFKYSEEFSKTEHYGVFDILSNGSQTIIPPSIHPNTNAKYVWVGESLFESDDLPTLYKKDLDKVLSQISSRKDLKTKTGRNNKLVQIITAKRSEGFSEDDIVEYILKYDKKHHEISLFTDPKEPYQAKDEDEIRASALGLVASVTRSLVRNKVKFQKRIEVVESAKITRFEAKALPKPPEGFFELFIETANKISSFDITNIAHAGAISLLSTVACGRVKFDGTWPNTYCLALARSGFGKGYVTNLVKEVINEAYLGADMYRSSSAFIKTIPYQSIRLDVIDEAATFFQSMKSTASYTSDLVDVVNKLYSLGSSRFDGVSTVKHGNKDGACRNPSINLLCLTHEAGFYQSFDQYLGTSGLMPRFLVFKQDHKVLNPSALESVDIGEEATFLKEFYKKIEKMFPYNVLEQFSVDRKSNKLYKALDLKIEPNAKEHFKGIKAECLMAQMENENEDNDPYLARTMEQITKLIITSCISRLSDTINIKDVEWAYALMKCVYYNTEPMRDTVSNSNSATGPATRVITFLKQKGVAVGHYQLMRALRIRKRDLDEALKILEDDDQIQIFETPRNGRPKRSYVAINTVQV